MASRISILNALPWIGAVAVTSWRLVALGYPHPADGDPAVVRHALAALGMLFVACGLWAWKRAPGPPTRLFALYGLTAGLHWGGPLGVGPPSWQALELAVYVVASSTLNQALLLHLALIFPRRLRPATRSGPLAALYAPVAIGALVAAGLLVAPDALSDLGSGVLSILLLVGMAYGYGAALCWIGRLILSPTDRRASGLALVVASLLLGALPHVVVSSVAAPSNHYGLLNLTLALFAITVAFVLSRDGAQCR